MAQTPRWSRRPAPRPSSSLSESRAHSLGVAWALTQARPGPSVCLHSHCHPAALPLYLCAFSWRLCWRPCTCCRRSPRSLGDVTCRPHAILLHAGLGCACLHHRCPPRPQPGLRSTSLGPRCTFMPPSPVLHPGLEAPHPYAPGQVLHKCPSHLTRCLRPTRERSLGWRGWHGQEVDRTPFLLASGPWSPLVRLTDSQVP